MSKKKKVDPIPDEFVSYQEAAEFWDKHDTTHYPGKFRTVKVVSEFRNRHYEIPIDGDVAIRLQQRVRRAGMPTRRLASELLRKELRAAGEPLAVAPASPARARRQAPGRACRPNAAETAALHSPRSQETLP